VAKRVLRARLLAHRATITGIPDAPPGRTERLVVMCVWSRRGEGWRVVAGMMAPADTAPAPAAAAGSRGS
jgi:hypothetical protein